MLHIPIVHAHDVSKQIPREKDFPSGWKCYKTIGSYVSCVFIKIWSTWKVWRALKKLELLSASPRVTLTHLLCSPNFPHASYLDERMLTYEPIVKDALSPTLIECCESKTKVITTANQKKRKNIFNPLTPVSDQDRISPYYIYTISCRQVMRIDKNVNYGFTN